MANIHFWIGTLGLLFWAIPMYWAGWVQASMWKQFTDEGMLAYPNFLQTVTVLAPLYKLRALGGLLYFSGILLAAWNLIKTAGQGSLTKAEAASAPALAENYTKHASDHWHRWIERKPVQFMIWTFVAVAIGGAIEMLPTFLIKSNVPTIATVTPYTPLEVEGRDLYIREGCVNCHSQMIRPFRSEVVRYDPNGMEYSKAGEFVYDHPFLWGSKRTGPDLHRIGGKYSDDWHYNHMFDPETVSPNTIMPRYPWIIRDQLNSSSLQAKMEALKSVGVPYTDEDIANAPATLDKQAAAISASLKAKGIECAKDREIIALISYLQRLGTDIHKKK